jgi:hypothetical protein
MKKMEKHEKKMEKTSPLKVCQESNAPSFELRPTHVKRGGGKYQTNQGNTSNTNTTKIVAPTQEQQQQGLDY